MTTPRQEQAGSVDPGGSVRGDGRADGDFHAAAMNLGEQAQAEGKAGVEHLRATAAEKVDTLAGSMQAAASELRRDDVGHLSGYVADLANGMSRFSSGLRNKSGDEMLRDVGRLARENPALFITGSIAIGFGLARFARASDPRHTALTVRDEDTRVDGTYGAAATSATARTPTTSASTGSDSYTPGSDGSGSRATQPASRSPSSTSNTPGRLDGDTPMQGGPYS